MSWNPLPTPLALGYLTTIENRASQLPLGPFRTYVLDHVNMCRLDQDHPYGPPAPSPECAVPPLSTGMTHGNQDPPALEEWLRLAAAEAQEPVPNWCALVHELDHAGGGGDNANKKGYRHRKKKHP